MTIDSRRPLRQRFDSNIKVHYTLEDLRPTIRLQYRRMLLMVTRVPFQPNTFQALVLLENGQVPSQTSIREFDRRQLAEMRRPPTWLLHQYMEAYAHE